MQEKLNAFTPLEKTTVREQNSLTGFTLVEIMAAIIIIAILVSMAAPLFNKTIEAAREKDAKTILQLIYTAERIYKFDRGIYFYDPSSTSGFSSDEGNIFYRYIDNPNARSDYYDYSITGGDSTGFAARGARKTGSPQFTINQDGNVI